MKQRWIYTISTEQLKMNWEWKCFLGVVI
jgi:hypothetical protein